MTNKVEEQAAFDEAALEEAYERALKLEKAGDFEAASLAYRQVLQIDPADHGGAAVRLASMGKGDVPPKAPDAYVATLFDQHAEMFDTILVDQLGYDVPLQLREVLLDLDEDCQFERMLDLGCGTGLSADALDDVANHKTGVDLSENMIEIAYEKGDYDELFVSEVVLFLQKTSAESWDLIVATDVLPYMGDLEAFFTGLKARINSNGVIAFSSETQPNDVFQGRDFMVGSYQRFAHAENYLQRLLSAHGFECLRCENIIVRHEQGQPVPGQLIVAKAV
jgi:predicted TPR repeat methyltransferase